MSRARFPAFVLLGLLVLSPLSTSAAQDMGDPAARRTAMSRLAFMLGDWAGPATSRGREGATEMRQTERVRSVVGGQVFSVQGVGRLLVSGTPGDTVFHAAAMIDWREGRGYVMRSYTLEGRTGEFPLVLATDGTGFDWGFEVPGGAVRYRMRLTDAGEWHEVGDFVREGAPPMRIFEMRLRRTDQPQ